MIEYKQSFTDIELQINYDDQLYTSAFCDRVVNEVIQPFAGRKSLKVLELGCGSGVFSRSFLKHKNEVFLTGIDLSRSLISKINKVFSAYADRSRFICETIRLDGLIRLDLPSYDIIFCGTFLHHLGPIQYEDLILYIQKMRKEDSIFAYFELKNPSQIRLSHHQCIQINSRADN